MIRTKHVDVGIQGCKFSGIPLCFFILLFFFALNCQQRVNNVISMVYLKAGGQLGHTRWRQTVILRLHCNEHVQTFLGHRTVFCIFMIFLSFILLLQNYSLCFTGSFRYFLFISHLSSLAVCLCM